MMLGRTSFSFFLTPFNLTLRWFYMSICFLNPLFQTRVHDEIPTYFFLRLLSRHFHPCYYPRPASGSRSNYSHVFFVDAPRSS
jgi:hypothetical protein